MARLREDEVWIWRLLTAAGVACLLALFALLFWIVWG